jgi:hypothetical protein
VRAEKNAPHRRHRRPSIALPRSWYVFFTRQASSA